MRASVTSNITSYQITFGTYHNSGYANILFLKVIRIP